MSHAKILCFLLLTGIFISCRKKETSSSTPCTLGTSYMPSFEKQFIFKAPGYWILKNTSTNVTDSVYIVVSPDTYYGIFPGGSGTGKDCQYAGNYEGGQVVFKHNLFPPTWLETRYRANTYDSPVFAMTTNSTSPISGVMIFDKNIGDSIVSGNVTSKLENKFSTLTVNTISYNDVYLMHYTPDLAGFKRIWWVKGIGFIRLEFVNPTTSLTETWELQRKSIQLAF
jgi:hypothetical protein